MPKSCERAITSSMSWVRSRVDVCLCMPSKNLPPIQTTVSQNNRAESKNSSTINFTESCIIVVSTVPANPHDAESFRLCCDNLKLRRALNDSYTIESRRIFTVFIKWFYCKQSRLSIAMLCEELCGVSHSNGDCYFLSLPTETCW